MLGKREKNPKFSKLIYRLLLTGFIVLAAFNFGSLFYIYAVTSIYQKAELKNFAPILESSAEKDLGLKAGEKTVILKSAEIKSWLEAYERSYSQKQDLRISSYKLNDFLQDLALSINVEPVNAKLEFKGEKATTFQPAISGVKLSIEPSAQAIMDSLRTGQASAELVIEKTEPAITLDKINNLGITSLLAQGESNFTGSSQARIHNIRVGAGKFNGLVLKPGEEFSFNNVLGQVDENSGFQAELVIKGGKLIPEFGGGVCQVSTTLFRAGIFAGLPIVERKPHSFPVRYYNPQGFDATIYPGVVNLRMVNNTPAHILIQSKIVGTKLFFEIYGTDDGRKVTVDGPYQYDQQPSGAMKAYFNRTVVSGDGSEKKERFDSNYKAPVSLAKNPLE